MEKAIRYSRHAETVIAQRDLSKSWIEEAVRKPDWRAPDPRDPEVERRFKSIAERAGRILRVACVEAEDEIRVVSAFIDRDARKPS